MMHEAPNDPPNVSLEATGEATRSLTKLYDGDAGIAGYGPSPGASARGC